MSMNAKFNKRNKGFTIIELMIVLVILAILLAIAYPSYIDYVRKGKRGEAQQALLNWAVNLEIYRSNNPNYDAPDATPSDDAFDNYNFVVDPGTNTYLLTANAVGDQTKDKARNGTPCNSLTLDQNGVKLPADCWE